MKLEAKARLVATRQIVAETDPWAKDMMKAIKKGYPKAKSDDIAFDGLYIPEAAANKVVASLTAAGYKKKGSSFKKRVSFAASKTQGLNMDLDDDDAMDDGKAWVILSWYDSAYD